MKKKLLTMLLTLCLSTSLFTLITAAETATEEAGVFGTKLSIGGFVSLILAAVAVIVVVVLCIVKREKLVAALAAYKSELKKITWFSWKNVVRCTVFVVVSVVVLALVIGLLDIAFFEIQYLLTGKGTHFFGG